MKEKVYIVENDSDLVKYFATKNFSKNKVKTYIKLGFIYVNSEVVLKLPYLLHKGDKIEVRKNASRDISIVYEDDNYLIVDKEAGLVTISTSNGKEEEDTLYRRVRKYANSLGEYVFIVNRIDKETSGLVVFVKNQKLKMALQENWNRLVKKRGYIAIVSGNISKRGRIDNYLYEDKMTFSHSTKVGGKRAITNYVPLKRNSFYTMLDVTIETGRKNQIRVHMSEMGHPIIGDKKYKSKENPLKRLGLHHYEITFMDPISSKLLTFTSEVPHEFYDLFD